MNKIYLILAILILITNKANAYIEVTYWCNEAGSPGERRDQENVFNHQEQVLKQILVKLLDANTKNEELEELKKEIDMRAKTMLGVASETDGGRSANKANLLIKQVKEAYNKRVQDYNAKIKTEVTKTKNESLIDPLKVIIAQYAGLEEIK